MTSRDFCYWLQGFFELRREHDHPINKGGLTQAQAETIEKHLALVFKHEIDPSMGPTEHQEELDALHGETGMGGIGPGGLVFRC